MKSLRPRTPTLPILLGVGLLDIVDGLLIIGGADRVTPNLQSGPYLFFALTFVDWDHSLLMAAILSLLWGALFLRDKAVAAMAAAAAFSHFMADWPVHNHDLALYPYASKHFGLGLWGSLGTGAWVAGGLFSAALLVLAWRLNARRQVRTIGVAVFIALLLIQLSPWASPMKFVAAGLSEPAVHLVHGALVTIGFLLPGLIFVALINHAERQAAGRRPVLGRRPGAGR